MAEKYSDFQQAFFAHFKQFINKMNIFVKMVDIYFLPFDFIPNIQLSLNCFHTLQYNIPVLRLYQYSSIEIGVKCSVFATFIESNM